VVLPASWAVPRGGRSRFDAPARAGLLKAPSLARGSR
jgi:hypothetical protein